VGNVLKKIVTLVFLGVISTVTITALATDNEPTGSAKVSSNITTSSAIKKEALTPIVSNSNEEAKTTIVQVKDKVEPILSTGWLLIMALFGFVMISNRSGV
jgi:hypothetical protein